jgi:hypothetical protein
VSVNPRVYAAIGAAVLLFGVGGWLYQAHGRHVEAKAITQADQHHEAGTTSEAQGVTHAQAADAKTPILQADAAEVARLRVEVARLRAAAPRPAPMPQTPGMPEPQPAGAPVESPLDAARDDLEGALTKENGDLKEALAERTAEAEAFHKSSDEYKAEVASLRIAIRAVPAPRTLAMGLLFGTNNTAGIWGEKDFGPVRVGADLVRRQLPTINQTNVEAVFRVGITLP